MEGSVSFFLKKKNSWDDEQGDREAERWLDDRKNVRTLSQFLWLSDIGAASVCASSSMCPGWRSARSWKWHGTRLVCEQNAPKLLKSEANIKKRLDHQINLPLLGSVDVRDLISEDLFVQLRLGQLLSVHTVVHQGQLVPLQVEADAQLPAESGDVLDGLVSKPLFANVSDLLVLLSSSIFQDENTSGTSGNLQKKEVEIGIWSVSILDAKAPLPT